MEENRELIDPMALLIKVDGIDKGSGFFVGRDLIATNIHVITKGTSVSAELRNFETNLVIKEFIVENVTAFDPKNDLVILKVAGEGMPLPIGDSDLLQRGDIIQAVGYPRGKYKVTEGSVHSIRDSDKWIRMRFRTDGGNSGGPVLNGNAEVIGVVVGDGDCYGYAVSANVVKILLAHGWGIEPLAQWQERLQTRAYAYLVQSQTKYSAAEKKHSVLLCGEAIIDLDNAIRLYPDYFLFHENRGGAHRFMGQAKVETGDLAEAQQHYQDAIVDYTEAINLCPDLISAYNNRGTVQSCLGQSKSEERNIAEAQRLYQGSIDDYTEAINLCPDYALAYNNRADAKCHFGKSEDAAGNVEAAHNLYQVALIDINTAIKLDSSYVVFYHTKGQIQAALGNYSAAIENYETARKIDPDYTDVCKDLELAKEVLEQQEKAQPKG